MIDQAITLELLKCINSSFESKSLHSFVNHYLEERTGFITSISGRKVDKFDYEQFINFITISITLKELFDIDFEYNDVQIIQHHNDSMLYLKNHFYSSRTTIGLHFTSAPGGMFHFIVHPVEKQTATVYMFGLYLLAKHSKETVTPFCEMLGEQFKNTLFNAIDEDVEFSDFLNTVIISQYPTLLEFSNIFMFDKIESLKKTVNKYTLINLKDGSFKSEALKKLTGHKIHSSTIDQKLLQAFTSFFKKMKEIKDTLASGAVEYYKYPLHQDLYPIQDEDLNEELIHFIKMSKSFNIFMKARNTVEDEETVEEFDNYIQIRKWLYQILKPFFFSYHYLFTKFSYFYNFEVTNLFYFIARLNDVDENNFIYQLQEIEKIQEEHIFTEKGDLSDYAPCFTLTQMYHLAQSNHSEQLTQLIVKILFGGSPKIFWTKRVSDYLALCVEEEKNDQTIYNELCKMHEDNNRKNVGTVKEFDRGMSRVTELQKMGLFKGIVRLDQNSKYLDFGGGKGEIAASIAKTYFLKKENVFVTDVKDWYGQDHTKTFEDIVTYRYLKVNKLPFESNSFNFVTCFQVLHHIPYHQVELVIKELARVISIGGVILFREHNCETVEDKMLIDVEHALYDFCHDKDTSKVFLQNYDEHYFSKKEFESLLQKYFTKVQIPFPEETKGVTKYYYTCWTKIENPDSAELILEPSNDYVKKMDYAFVWLLMKGDAYTPGVFTSVHSINRTRQCSKEGFNTVVMVTPDVSEEAIYSLSNVADYIVHVDYLQHATKAMRTEKQRELYSSWIDVSYTKWRALCLPFKKIIFLDADVIVLDTIDSLFNLQAPAGHFSSAFAKPCGKMENPYVNKDIVGEDDYARHGVTITKDMLAKGFNKLTTVHATSILLKPSVKDFTNYVNMLQTQFKDQFGFDTNSGADEQSIVYYYSLYPSGPQKEWTNIHQRYNFHSWKTERFLKNEMPYVIHFMSQPKVWMMKVSEYEDLVNWYVMFLDAVKTTGVKFNEIMQNVGKNKSVDKLLEVCYNLPQTYINRFSTHFQNLRSCLDLVCKIESNKIVNKSWADYSDDEL